MYDDENEDIGLDEELCENCPLYRQRPPVPGGFGPQFPPPFSGQGPGFGPSDGPPSGPPPAITPQLAGPQGIGIQAVDPGSIRRCRYRFVYLQLRNGREFWAWLTFVGRRSVAGWRWTGYRWVYFGISLRQIESFYCY
ncbi:MAG: hypothetical protein ACYCYE_12600 [Clostridia bacterium]